MSRIIGLTLLFVILVDNFSDSTAFSAGFPVTKVEIRKCRCTHISSGKRKCPIPLLPTTNHEKKDLIQCLCSKTQQHKCTKFRPFCCSTPRVPVPPITIF